MLEMLRKGAGGWIAKLLLVLLVISFAVWGIADVYTGYGRQTLASVGSVEISPREFERAYQNQLTSLSQRLGRQLTSDEIRSFGLPQQVLSRLVGGAAVDLHARALGVGVSDGVISEALMREPAFQDSSGKFSRERFDQALRANGLTEGAIVAEERTESVRRQLVGSIAAPAQAPQILIDAISRYQGEARTMQYFILPVSAAGDIPEPAAEQLSSYYDLNKPRFTVPEFRKTALIAVSPAALKEKVEVKEEDIAAAYESRKDRFGTPEKRKIQQIAFPDLAAAQTASQRLSAPGADFNAIAKELGFTESDIDLGVNARTDLSDPKVAEAAFQLKPNEVSAPVEGRLSTVIVRVTEIQPGQTKSFDEVKEQLRNDLALEVAATQVTALANKVEDDRAGGAPIAEIAKNHGLKLTEVTIARDGRTLGDARGEPLPDSKELFDGIFEAEPGTEGDSATIAGGGTVWYDVLEIIPERVKPLDEVKGQAVAGWRDGEVRSRLAAKANELTAAAKPGGPLADLAKPFNAEVKTTKPLKRADAEPGLPISFVTQAFAIDQGGYASVAAPTGGRAIFTVTAITPPAPFDEKQTADARRELLQSLATDYAAQYLAALKAEYGVRFNPNALSTLTGIE